MSNCKCVCHKVGLFGLMCCPCTEEALRRFAHGGDSIPPPPPEPPPPPPDEQE